jgi:hypothetical protein
MIIAILLGGVAILLLWIGLIVSRLFVALDQSRQLAATVALSMSPREYSFLDEIVGKPNPPRTIFDQIGATIAQLDGRVTEIDNKLAYLRSYVWEIRDDRFLRDIKTPPKSSRWDKAFASPEDPDTYGLWMRERDLEEEFDRDVVAPTNAKRNQLPPTDGRSDAAGEE